MIRRLLLPTLLLLLRALVAAPADDRAPFLVNYDSRVNGPELALRRTAILAHDALVHDEAAAKRAGTKILGYVNIGELDKEDAANPELKGIRFVGKNTEWAAKLPDLESPVWSKWILDVCAKRVADRGWDGFFLDTLDSARLPEREPEEFYVKREKAVAAIVAELRRRHPGKIIIANRGFNSLRLVPDAFDGVMAEGVLSTYTDLKEKKYARVPAEETTALRKELDHWKAGGKRVLALDYANPNDRKEAAALYEKLTSFGYEAAVATPDLMNGAMLAPLKRRPSRALVIFGNDVGEGLVEHGIETESNCSLYHPLVRHGVIPEYRNVREEGFPSDLSGYDLVVIESFDPKPETDLVAAAKTLAEHIRAGRKVLFFSDISPWANDFRAWEILAAATGWTGSGAYGEPDDVVSEPMGDKAVLAGEAVTIPSGKIAMPDLKTPANGRVLIRQNAKFQGFLKNCDCAFVAPFGGVLLEPWVFETDPLNNNRGRVDFFAFVDRLLGEAAPTFDTTTRAGCRLYFGHVDGDALHADSTVITRQLSGEIMRDLIFKKYALPFTSSVITAEMQGKTLPRATKQQVERRREIARSIFALPNVEIASHAFRHPFAWTNDDSTRSAYSQESLQLIPQYDHPMDYREETVGSVDYIDRELAPPGKKCRLMLWTGNCLPPVEAIRYLDERGIPNMNGIATAITRDAPWQTNIRGGIMIRQGVVQVGAPFENDNVYYDMNKDGLEGGFSRVIEAFQLTGEPRRLLPVNAYWHFFSADTPERLKSLVRVLDWVKSQPLHPIWASEYASMMRDLRHGAGYEDVRGGHVFAMPPGCLTIRHPGTVHVDMKNSVGILGYTHDLGETYIHTDGSPRVVLRTRTDDDKLPKLIRSTTPLEIARTDTVWTVRFTGVSPGKARFEGLPPAAAIRCGTATLSPDNSGTFEHDAQPGDTWEIPVTH